MENNMLKSQTPSLLDPQAYTYVGKYGATPFGAYFFIAWYQEELARKVGIEAPFGGWCEFRGGQVFYNTAVVEDVITRLTARVIDRDMSFFRAITLSAEEEFSHAVEYMAALATAEENLERDFAAIVQIGKQITFYWCLGWILSQAIDRLAREAEGPFSAAQGNVLEHMPQFSSPLTEQQAAARELKNILVEEGVWSSDPVVLARSVAQSPKAEKLLAEHISKYGWIENIDWNGQLFTKEKLLDQLQYVTETQPNVPTGLLDEYEELFRAGSINQTGSEYISILAHAARDVFGRVAQRLGITYDDLRYLMPEEILQDGKFATDVQKTAAHRRAGETWCVYTDTNNSAKVFHEAEAIAELEQRFLPKETVVLSNTLQGQIGCKGKAQGRVKVITSTEDFHRFEAGDVLVAHMTTPDYVLLMQKSAAIVTDMGGMLSHAAIVSRELGKPCVIGTKVATQVFKDGDLVEVDADKGVVRILEKLV